jgi:hypothetical protein
VTRGFFSPKISNAMSRTRFLLALPLFTITLQAAPTDWSQWRGPNRDGVSAEAGLLKDWPADGPRLAWQIKGVGKGNGLRWHFMRKRFFVLGRREGGQFVTAFRCGPRSANSGARAFRTAATNRRERRRLMAGRSLP